MSEPIYVVLMGVSGCGKSYVGEHVAPLLALPLIEGDDFHPRSNIDKMARGELLDDDDRADWLRVLGEELKRHRDGALLACSALKQRYRDTLRIASPGLVFVHLSITRAQAEERVSSRTDHFYPASLVASQFEALEKPAGEPQVLVLDGSTPVDTLAPHIADWLRAGSGA